jgi:hypothetical protein
MEPDTPVRRCNLGRFTWLFLHIRAMYGLFIDLLGRNLLLGYGRGVVLGIGYAFLWIRAGLIVFSSVGACVGRLQWEVK